MDTPHIEPAIDSLEVTERADAARQVRPTEILLVEDNAGDALLVGQALTESAKAVHLHVACDGEQALQILAESGLQPDLIILDLNVPKLSGFTVLASYPLKKTPIVVFTASESKHDMDRARMLGACACVHKPTDLEEYKSAVSSMVQNWANQN